MRDFNNGAVPDDSNEGEGGSGVAGPGTQPGRVAVAGFLFVLGLRLRLWLQDSRNQEVCM